jgi:hypothetical protein
MVLKLHKLAGIVFIKKTCLQMYGQTRRVGNAGKRGESFGYHIYEYLNVTWIV